MTNGTRDVLPRILALLGAPGKQIHFRSAREECSPFLLGILGSVVPEPRAVRTLPLEADEAASGPLWEVSVASAWVSVEFSRDWDPHVPPSHWGARSRRGQGGGLRHLLRSGRARDLQV